MIGTTTGSRRNLGREILPLPELAAWLRRRKARGKAALLFGSEKTGLSNEDMSHCHALVRIPTTPDCPSMNLGQAVAVCAYELTRSGIVTVPTARVTAHRSEPANQQALDHIFDHAVAHSGCLGLSPPQKPRRYVVETAPHVARFEPHLQRCASPGRSSFAGGVEVGPDWQIVGHYTVKFRSV